MTGEVQEESPEAEPRRWQPIGKEAIDPRDRPASLIAPLRRGVDKPCSCFHLEACHGTPAHED